MYVCTAVCVCTYMQRDPYYGHKRQSEARKEFLISPAGLLAAPGSVLQCALAGVREHRSTIRGPILGVPLIRIIVYLGVFWGTPFVQTPFLVSPKDNRS